MENQNKDFIGAEKEGTQDNSSENFFLTSEVKKGYIVSIRARIDTLLIERGLKWADIYNALGWSKSFASIVRNGKLIPPNWQRVALAKQFGVDTTVIWDIPEVQSADNLQNNNSGVAK